MIIERSFGTKEPLYFRTPNTTDQAHFLLYGFLVPQIIIIFIIKDLGRDSSVGIATRYELDGPGIESR
jgi:hypothetical protein